jgi:hypothetical protein
MANPKWQVNLHLGRHLVTRKQYFVLIASTTWIRGDLVPIDTTR